MIGVYGIHNVVTDKWYVGSSNDVGRRWQEHQRHLKKDKHGNPKLQAAYNKYGKDTFQYHILAEYTSVDNLEHNELLWAILLDAIKGGYVLKAGNRNGVVSDETRKKMSASFKGRVSSMKGQKHSPETIQKLSDLAKNRSPKHQQKITESKTGKSWGSHSQETKDKISAAKKGEKKPPLTEEHKQKLSIAGTGRKHSPETIQKMRESYAKRRRKGTEQKTT
jgi:group I intron endonuclease